MIFKTRSIIRLWLSTATLISLFSGCSLKKEKIHLSEATLLTSPADSTSGEPYLFTDENEATYLSWVSRKGDTSVLYYSSLKDNNWSQPQAIASGSNWFVNWADYPTLALNNKVLIANYLVKSGANTYAYDVHITSSQNGVNWSNAKLLNEDHKQAEHGFVSIVPYGDNFFMSWLDGRNTAMEEHEEMNYGDDHHGAMSIRAAVVNTSGAKLKEWELDNRVCDCCQTSAAVTTNGPVVVYRDRSQEEVRDISIVRWMDGDWSQPKTIYADNWKINGCPVNGPRIAPPEKTTLPLHGFLHQMIVRKSN